jgi:hypothetical protein
MIFSRCGGDLAERDEILLSADEINLTVGEI